MLYPQKKKEGFRLPHGSLCPDRLKQIAQLTHKIQADFQQNSYCKYG
jgi:hypothetical protein